MKSYLKILKYNEYFTLIMAIFIFMISPIILRWFDPTAAAFDAGVLQAPILAIVEFCILQAFVWLALKVVWTDLASFIQNYFIVHFNNLSSWQKCVISLGLYLALFLFLVILTKV